MATERESKNLYDQEMRARWRSLLLVIKAKLEAIECGISSIEAEFMAYIVMPNNMTIGEWVIDQALPAIRDGRMPPLALPPGRVIDADFQEK